MWGDAVGENDYFRAYTLESNMGMPRVAGDLDWVPGIDTCGQGLEPLWFFRFPFQLDSLKKKQIR